MNKRKILFFLGKMSFFLFQRIYEMVIWSNSGNDVFLDGFYDSAGFDWAAMWEWVRFDVIVAGR